MSRGVTYDLQQTLHGIFPTIIYKAGSEWDETKIIGEDRLNGWTRGATLPPARNQTLRPHFSTTTRTKPAATWRMTNFG